MCTRVKAGRRSCGLCMASRRAINARQPSGIGRDDWPGDAECKSRYAEPIRGVDASGKPGSSDCERYYQKRCTNLEILFANVATLAVKMVNTFPRCAHPSICEVVSVNG